MSLMQNETLNYLKEHFPQIVNYVPDDVLEFGLPNRYITLFVVLYIFILMIISLAGNSLMVFLYGR